MQQLPSLPQISTPSVLQFCVLPPLTELEKQVYWAPYFIMLLQIALPIPQHLRRLLLMPVVNVMPLVRVDPSIQIQAK